MSGKHASARSVILRKAKTALSLPASTLTMAFVVWVLLWSARLLTLALPIRYLSRFLGSDHGLQAETAGPTIRNVAKVQSLATAMDLAARYHPLRGTCYAQAAIAHVFLKAFAVSHTIHFGVRRPSANSDASKRGGLSSEGAMDAHAWVMAGSEPVCGTRRRALYTQVRCFVTQCA